MFLLMELFYSGMADGDMLVLDEEESGHCAKVLRHSAGDMISVIDGKGTLMDCRIVSASPRRVEAEVLSRTAGWGGHPYDLQMAVCPTKNMDRYEWFAGKACEIGVDSIVPVTGEHSERKVLKPERVQRILLSSAKQSLKGKIPEILEGSSVKDYISSCRSREERLKLVACCFEDGSRPRISIREALEGMPAECRAVSVLIGPEGDFSTEEVRLAVECGFIPVHIGPSRLRTETAAIAAVMAVYSHFLL